MKVGAANLLVVYRQFIGSEIYPVSGGEREHGKCANLRLLF